MEARYVNDSTAETETDSESNDYTATDPTAPYRGPAIPRPLGNRLRTAMGLEDRPDYFGDWVEAWVRIANRDGIEMDLDALCTADESPHLARFNGRTQHYQCVQDPIIVPFLADDVAEVDIETRSPQEGNPAQLTVTRSGITADPEDVVFSFGVTADPDPPSSDGPSPILAYSQFCPYGHAFTSPDEYEAWAAETEAYTMVTSMGDVFELARAIGRIAE